MLLRRRRILVSAALALGLSSLATAATAAATATATATATPASAASPLEATALWVTRVSTPELLDSAAAGAGVRTLIVKAGEGSGQEPQFTPALVASLRTAGDSVCAWTFVTGVSPAAEAAVAVAAARAGAQCLVIDAEAQYDTRYGAAQTFVHDLRSALGPHFPIALAGEAEVLQHPRFPYSVFLGPGGFQLDAPQTYWRQLGLSPGAALQLVASQNAIYGRPLAPVGELFGAPVTAEVMSFIVSAHELGSVGVSFFDLDAAQPTALSALIPEPVPDLLELVRPATVSPGADGDEVLWAQELLNAAGAHLPVGGYFGAMTGRAIVAFQARHHLHRDELLDAATWRALQRYRAREPSWAHTVPDSAR
jgi:hypothetical protein